MARDGKSSTKDMLDYAQKEFFDIYKQDLMVRRDGDMAELGTIESTLYDKVDAIQTSPEAKAAVKKLLSNFMKDAKNHPTRKANAFSVVEKTLVDSGLTKEQAASFKAESDTLVNRVNSIHQRNNKNALIIEAESIESLVKKRREVISIVDRNKEFGTFIDELLSARKDVEKQDDARLEGFAEQSRVASKKEAKDRLEGFFSDVLSKMDLTNPKAVNLQDIRELGFSMEESVAIKAKADSVLLSIETIEDAMKDPMFSVLGNLRNQEARVSELERAGYVPQKRFGEFTMTLSDKEGVQVFARFDTKAEAEMAYDEFLKTGKIEGYDSTEGRFSNEQRSAMTVQYGAVSNTLSNVYAGVIDPDMIEMVADKVARDESDEYRTEIARTMRGIASQMAAVNSHLKNELKRKGTQGESKNIERVFADAAVMVADNSAKRLAGFRMLSALQEADKNKASDVEGLGEYLAKAYKYIMEPQEEFSFVRGAMFYMKKIGRASCRERV
jgi:hypothetical protein